jgi:carbon-monoxide dehydrogenase medium subunit
LKPPKFEYYAPRALDEALEILVRHCDGARVLAGGQSLIPMLNLRLLAPRALIDLNRIPELAYIAEEAGLLRFGDEVNKQGDIKKPYLKDCRRWSALFALY